MTWAPVSRSPGGPASPSVPDHRPCVFPFVYKGRRFSACTRVGGWSQRPWCATTGNYDLLPEWRYCSEDAYGGSSGGQPCFFPFVYRGQTIHSCIPERRQPGKFWCSTTASYDQDRRWSFCPDTALTETLPNRPCVFPFLYREKFYHSCTETGASEGKAWCATTNNYDVDRKWRPCHTTTYGGNSNGESCVFPFIHNKSPSYRCLEGGQGREGFWCGTTSNYDRDKLWSYCPDTMLSQERFGPSCVFPFIYKGRPHNSCVALSHGAGRFWCSTTSSYDSDGRWDYCAELGFEGGLPAPRCVFPFVFEGQLYSGCTNASDVNAKLWCATTDNYDRDRLWALCPS
ncbi:epididymal sperm-binding protein 1-like [Tachyglossus aculeatus]|uniref:epididymal sperm-binding protein 1-like n=1 Tax=Tachyglossus aculeatus TaxID=9261 RepID=UPI0018F54DBE|nr:epididymal sperm-binding protein 1-like [Tachyglossus aculeatus]